jgi:hypothetical protein
VKTVKYKTHNLARNSKAFELWETWQATKTDRNVAQRALDKHLAEVEQAHKDLLTRYDK